MVVIDVITFGQHVQGKSEKPLVGMHCKCLVVKVCYGLTLNILSLTSRLPNGASHPHPREG